MAVCLFGGGSILHLREVSSGEVWPEGHHVFPANQSCRSFLSGFDSTSVAGTELIWVRWMLACPALVRMH